MWASRSHARSPGTVGLKSSSCPSARVFAPRFFQTSPRGSVLALRYHFASIRLFRGLSPPSYRTCPIRACRPAKLYENHLESSKNTKGLEWRGRPSIGKVEAVNMSDPERACLSE